MKKIFLIILSAFSLSVWAQVPSFVPSNDLVSYYSFSGNANDLSGNGNNGTVNGATLTSDRFGNLNSAYAFNGSSDYIQATLSNFNSGNTSKSISVWCQTSSANYTKSLVEYSNSNTTNSIFGLYMTNQGFPYTSNYGNQVTGTDTINNNQWHHLVAVFDGSMTNLYIDNILVSNGTYSYNTLAGTLTIGRLTVQSQFGEWMYWNGKIDDVGIWNRALTAQEVNNLYQGGICYQMVAVTDTLYINTSLTGFNPITYQNSIKVYPNPTHDHLLIDNGNYNQLSGYQVKIMNSMNQVLFQQSINQQQFDVNLSGWSSGLYFLYLINGTGETMDIRKIVLQ